MDYRDMEERLFAGREDYRKIPVPEGMKAKLEAGISRAQAERKAGRMREKMPINCRKLWIRSILISKK